MNSQPFSFNNICKVVFGILIFLIPVKIFAQDPPSLPARVLLKKLKTCRVDTARITLYTELAYHQVFKVGSYKSDLDSAQDYLNKALILNNKNFNQYTFGKICLAMAHLRGEQNDFNSARQNVLTAIDIFKKFKNYYLLGASYVELSRYYTNYDNDLIFKINLFKNAAESFHLARNWHEEGHARETMGDLLQFAGKSSDALRELSTALKLYKFIHASNLLGVYSLLESANTQLGNYKEAVGNGISALKNAEMLHDTTSDMVCTIKNRMGVAWDYLHDYQRALFYFRQSIYVAQHNNDTKSIFLLTTNIVSDLIKLAKYREALVYWENISSKYQVPSDLELNERITEDLLELHTHLQNYKQARIYCEQLVTLVKEHKINFVRGRAINYIVRYYITTGQFKEAKKFRPLLDSLIRNSDNKYYIMVAYRLAFQLDSAQHQLQAGMEHLIIYHKLKDSLDNLVERKYLQTLDAKYEQEKSEKDIQIWKTKSKLQQNELERTSMVKNAILGLSILLLVILGLIYSQDRIKQRKNREITKKNEKLEGLLREKEILVKEIHHRVKNNLQTVVSLLQTQSSYLDNEALAAIQNGQHRIQTISLLHQKLYLTDNISTINIDTYFREIITFLRDSFHTSDQVFFEINLIPLELHIEQAVPLGLIVNEVVTNSLKYAFATETGGTIGFFMHENIDGTVGLEISDNGIGMPENFNFGKPDSLGLKLVKGLAEDLGGKLKIDTEHGTKVTVIFNAGKNCQDIIF